MASYNDPEGVTDLGNNLVRMSNGMTVDRNNNWYIQAVKDAATKKAAQPVDEMRYASGTAGAQQPLAKPVATAPTVGAFSYVPPGVPQLGNPIREQQGNLVMGMLNNPHTLNDQSVNQMKEQGKEQAVGLHQQLAEKMAQDAAARGLSSRGGFVAGNEAKLGEQLASDLTRGNRDIDLQRVATNRSDELNALAASDQFLGNDLQRALQSYGGQLAGAGHNLDAYKTDLSGYFGQLDANRGDKALDTQAALGQGGLALDQQRLGEQGRQFNLSQALAIQQFLESQRQFNGQLGLGYNTLDQNGQQNSLSNLYRTLGL